jgi:hypothetical protein
VFPGEVRYYHLLGATIIEMNTGDGPQADAVIVIGGEGMSIVFPEASWFIL